MFTQFTQFFGEDAIWNIKNACSESIEGEIDRLVQPHKSFPQSHDEADYLFI